MKVHESVSEYCFSDLLGDAWLLGARVWSRIYQKHHTEGFKRALG